MRSCFSLQNLASAVMARAVAADMAAGRTGVPAPWRTAKRCGLRAEQIRHLWDGRFDRVGTGALARLAEKHGGKIRARHGRPVLVAAGSYAPTFPDLGGRAKPITPEEALARARAREATGGERGVAMGRAEFSMRMKPGATAGAEGMGA